MELSNSIKIKIPLRVEEKDLTDKDIDIFYLVLFFNLFELHQLAMQHFRYLVNFYHAWESDLAKFIIPQKYNFLEFVTWCMSNYILSQRSFVSKNGSILFVVNSQSISKMLNPPQNPERETLI
jgi:hypothetical protein